MKGRTLCAILLGLFLCGLALALSSPFQTWYLNKVLGRSGDLQGSVSFVCARFGHIQVRGLVLQRSRATLTLPDVTCEMPVLRALIKDQFNVGRIEAKSWTLDLSQWTQKDFGDAKKDSVDLAKAALALGFKGVFSELSLPLGISIEDLQTQGDVLLPPAHNSSDAIRVHVSLVGGKMQVGKDAHFDFTLVSDSTGTNQVPLDTMLIKGSLDARMSTAHSFSNLGLLLDAAARGPKIPLGVTLVAKLNASELAVGERYSFSLKQASNELVNLSADFDRKSSRVSGLWNVNGSNSDLEPFILGRVLPVFNLSGSGSFNTDSGLMRTRVSGTLGGKVDHLGLIRSELNEFGELKIQTQFDLTRADYSLRIDRLNVHVAKTSPLLELNSLQAFAFNIKTGELQVADAAKPLLGITSNSLPLIWLKPWLGSYTVNSGDLQGSCQLVADSGGLALNSDGLIKGVNVSLSHHNKVLFKALDMQSPLHALYTPHGWQLDLPEGSLIHAATPVLFAVKWGRLAGLDQPLKVSGHIDADTQAWLIFSHAHGIIPYIPQEDEPKGHVLADITASLGEEKTSIIKFKADHLLIANTGATLPDLFCQLTLNENKEGHISFTAPIEFGQSLDHMELMVTGDAVYIDDLFHLKAQVASDRVDASVFAVVKELVFKKQDESGPALIPIVTPPKQAFWSGVEAQIAFNLKEVIITGSAPGHLSGELVCDPLALHLNNVRIGYAQSGDIQLDASVHFDAKNLRPYDFSAELKTKDWNPGLILKAFNPTQPPSVEGKFDIEAHLLGRGASLDELTQRLHGDCTLTSKSGSFGMLTSHFIPKLGKLGKLDQTLSLVNSMSDALIGRRLPGDLMNSVSALTTFAKLISPIRYDQLSVTISRDDTLDTELKDFTLIAPEIRLGGIGRITEVEGISLLNQPMAMDFRLRARGHLAEALKVAGILNAKKPDDLGYLPCTLPIQIGGSIAHPDTTQFEASLQKIAIDRSGAGELLNRIIGN